MRPLLCLIMLLAPMAGHTEPFRKSRDIFPPQDKHVHGSSLALLPNGDLLAAWFHGSGERTANDVLIQGARLDNGADVWGSVSTYADTPNLPDCNPVLFLDRGERLWLFWIAARANAWEHSLLKFRYTDSPGDSGPPAWDWQGNILLQPGDAFIRELERGFDELDPAEEMWAEYAPPYTRLLLDASHDKAKRQEGWMTRNHPIQLESGRILLPLYSDGFNLGLIAISDDDGRTWRASKPIVGLAGIQPTLARKQNGEIVAYLRDTGGPPNRVLRSTSTDHGESWSVMRDTNIPNPSSSLQVCVLDNGWWAMIYNDTEDGRGSMALALSDNEGESWRWTRHIGTTEKYEYPSMLQDKHGSIHVSYSYTDARGRRIRHDTVNLDWIQVGD